MLSKEEAEQIKEEIFNQINTTFPEDKRDEAINQIEAMNEAQFEEFLKQNNFLKGGSNTKPSSQNDAGKESIFRLIVSGEVPSYKIDENKDSIAVLDINPLSYAHTIIIPKEKITEADKIPRTAFSLAKKIAKKVKTKFNANDNSISTSKIMGEVIINLVPSYEDPELNKPKQNFPKDELEKIKSILEAKPKKKTVRKQRTIKIKEKKLWLPKRIP